MFLHLGEQPGWTTITFATAEWESLNKRIPLVSREKASLSNLASLANHCNYFLFLSVNYLSFREVRKKISNLMLASSQVILNYHYLY